MNDNFPFAFRPALSEAEKDALGNMMNEVHLSAILDHIAAQTFEAADSVGHSGEDACEGGLCLVQQASVVSAAALFCKTWENFK